MTMQETNVFALRKAFTANAITDTYAAHIPTITEPTGTGVYDVRSTPGNNILLFVPYSIGADDTDYHFKIVLWRSYVAAGVTMWIPAGNVIIDGHASTEVGVAAAPILNTERFADSLVYVSGDNEVQLPTTTANTAAWGTWDIKGAQKVQFLVDIDAGAGTAATSVNILFGLY